MQNKQHTIPLIGVSPKRTVPEEYAKVTLSHISLNFLLLVPPSITRPPSDKTVIFGGNATLMCRAEGIPKPHITWLNNLGITADTDPRTTVLSTGDLLIQNIQLKDAGRYVCVAENNLGKDTAQVILILTGLSKLDFWSAYLNLFPA